MVKIDSETSQPVPKSRIKKNVKALAEEELVQTAGYSIKSHLSDSWESIKISPRDALSQEVEEHLTMEERNELLRTIQQRKVQAAANMDYMERAWGGCGCILATRC